MHRMTGLPALAETGANMSELMNAPTGSNNPALHPEVALRATWTAEGVPLARHDELIAQITAKGAPGAKVGPFTIPAHIAPRVSAPHGQGAFRLGYHAVAKPFHEVVLHAFPWNVPGREPLSVDVARWCADDAGQCDALQDVVRNLATAGTLAASPTLAGALEAALAAVPDGASDRGIAPTAAVREKLATALRLARTRPWLNPAQRAVLASYAGGEFAHLAKLEREEEYRHEQKQCRDSLLSFLLVELATSEDCDTRDEAERRVCAAIRDLRAVRDSLRAAPDWQPWENPVEITDGL
ncbi:hypothetical protein [Paraburkholderia flagellata]|uniref:hypothetical protein n=1 Tax=Paraburkholderia flagellata TaxID=2883241 RepID=UPI001F260A5B|nr:hypothetical protein [Paraburkholderia flagellata]